MFTITQKGKPLDPIELGHLHAWVMKVQAEIQKAYAMVGVLDYLDQLDGDAEEIVAALEAMQFELDDVAWLIDEETWLALHPEEDYEGVMQ